MGAGQGRHEPQPAGHVAQERAQLTRHATAHGLQRVSLDSGVPCTFGVLTCDTMAQADARAGGDKGNKGDEAADAAVAMMNLITAAQG